MDTVKDKTWVQCLNCGHMHIVERVIPIDISIVRSCCPKCEYDRSLNCGYNEMDVLELKNYDLDERYYY